MVSFTIQEDIKYFNKIHTFKLEGNTTFAYFYTSVYVGTPPQRQTVIVDTGSYLLAFPCTDCKESNCGKHINQPYDPKKSLTSSEFSCYEKYENFQCSNCNSQKQCQWSISYAEGSSLRGHVLTDYIVVGDEIQNYVDNDYQKLNLDFVKFLNRERVDMLIGCTTKETNLFLTQDADGILGLSPSTNTPSRWPNLVDSLFSQHSENQEELVFSLCLSNVDGGYMSVGGYNTELHLKGAKTHIIPFKKGSSMYSIDMEELKINGKSLGASKKVLSNAIVDSGTTILYGPKKIIDEMYQTIYDFCDQSEKNCVGSVKRFGNQKCWKRDAKNFPNIQDFFDTFPPIEFKMNKDFTFVWEPSSYLFEDPLKPNYIDQWCFAFEASGSKFLLGGSWMRQYDILFDRGNHQLHFTQSDCNSQEINNSYIKEFGSQIQTAEEDIELYNQIGEFLGPQFMETHQPLELGTLNQNQQNQKNDQDQNQDQDSNNDYDQNSDSDQNNDQDQNQDQDSNNDYDQNSDSDQNNDQDQNQDQDSNNDHDQNSDSDQNNDTNQNLNGKKSDEEIQDKQNLNQGRDDQNQNQNDNKTREEKLLEEQKKYKEQLKQENQNKQNQSKENNSSQIKNESKSENKGNQNDSENLNNSNDIDGEPSLSGEKNKEGNYDIMITTVSIVLAVIFSLLVYRCIKKIRVRWNINKKVNKLSQFDQDTQQFNEPSGFDKSGFGDPNEMMQSNRMMQEDEKDEDLTQEVDQDYQLDDIEQQYNGGAEQGGYENENEDEDVEDDEEEEEEESKKN
ncbi:Aspartic peptidase domain [Pseudocohnilembus persalinus]|uniref:Aspartic peptidase domain n=1 Tax=Pseudocohnilembus persalinus TaxID=266149 RepID=A0A0V0Q7S9_PSEPJ|nr:Aspartic peptidase domain [Pseudocohnilembus persalinus]|eukprot:KRW98301.1 Aspartic peptidase domain [Pseudocohnilembus persalinus]